jgi:hypothetical protein
MSRSLRQRIEWLEGDRGNQDTPDTIVASCPDTGDRPAAASGNHRTVAGRRPRHQGGQAIVGQVTPGGIAKIPRFNPMQSPMHKAPRCGAKTRSNKPCQSPARNGLKSDIGPCPFCADSVAKVPKCLATDFPLKDETRGNRRSMCPQACHRSCL